MTNLEWLIENNLWFRDVCCSVAHLMGVNPKPLTLREWLLADCGQIADMSGKDAESVRSGDETSAETPDFTENPQKSACCAKNDARLDTREKLEQDASAYITRNVAGRTLGLRGDLALHDAIISLLDRQADITTREMREWWGGYTEQHQARIAEMHEDVKRAEKRADELQEKVDDLHSANRKLGKKLQDMKMSCDHWNKVAGKHANELKGLRRELKDARKYGSVWPRFEDGKPVEIGDVVGRRIGSIEFFADKFELRAYDHTCISCDLYGTEYSRPPLLAHDYQPVEVGQVLYGLSDGKAWEVSAIDHTEPRYPVNAFDPGKPAVCKLLKPEWLVHKKPSEDSWEKLRADFFDAAGTSVNAYCERNGIDMAGKSTLAVKDAVANHMWERIEKLSGKVE